MLFCRMRRKGERRMMAAYRDVYNTENPVHLN
jgi:hypothetical protein